MANINDNEQSSASQCKQIEAWLNSGRTLTQLEALDKFQCMRLASRIGQLRDRGMNIKTDKITLLNGKKVARYSLVK